MGVSGYCVVLWCLFWCVWFVVYMLCVVFGMSALLFLVCWCCRVYVVCCFLVCRCFACWLSAFSFSMSAFSCI